MNGRISIVIALLVHGALLLPSPKALADRVCIPTTEERVMTEWNGYLSRENATPSAETALYSCLMVNAVNDIRVVCLTKPTHPAHLSIVVRKAHRQADGPWEMYTGANTTTKDCDAFLLMMDEFEELNRQMREEIERSRAGP
jgi:hypothetical protein